MRRNTSCERSWHPSRVLLIRYPVRWSTLRSDHRLLSHEPFGFKCRTITLSLFYAPRDPGLPVVDQRVIGEEPGQRCP